MKKSIILTTLCTLAAFTASAATVQLRINYNGSGVDVTNGIANWSEVDWWNISVTPNTSYDYNTNGINNAIIYIYGNSKVDKLPTATNAAYFTDIRFSDGSTLDLNGNTLFRGDDGGSDRNFIIKTQGSPTTAYTLKNGTINSTSTTVSGFSTSSNLAIGAGKSAHLILGDGEGTNDTVIDVTGTSMIVQKSSSTDTTAGKLTIKSDAIIKSASFRTNATISADVYGTIQATGALQFGGTSGANATSTTNIYSGASISNTGSSNNLIFRGTTTIHSGANVSTEGATYFKANTTIKNNFSSAKSIEFGDANSTYTATIDSGASVESTGSALTFGSNAVINGVAISKGDLTFKKTLNVGNSGAIQSAGGVIAFNGHSTINGNVIGFENKGISFSGGSTIGGTVSSMAEMNFTGANTNTVTGTISATHTRIKTGATLEMKNKLADTGNGGIAIYGDNSKLILNAIDVKYDTKARQISLANGATNNHSIIEVKKSNKLKWIAFTAKSGQSAQTLDIQLTGTAEVGRALVEFDTLFKTSGGMGDNYNATTLGADAYLEFTSFDNGDLWFSKSYVDGNSWKTDFTKVKVDGETLFSTQEDFDSKWEWQAAQIGSENGYYLMSTVIPEPAEWAAIFGAIALGFAMFRRRK